MGVPAFYRWLREKYPKCIADCIEEIPMMVDGVEIPINLSAANPNGCEFDNLYLDLNGIIHPCVHPEDIPAPESEEEMFCAIFAYIDRLVCAVRPRKILYLAIDGVAPRAKMNQQRARRFKTAQDMAEEEEVEEELRAALRAKGQKVPPKKKATFDHNVITPGTMFMDRLATFLRYYAQQRLDSHAGWRHLNVVLSDASVPGEGEHKIMEFIRQQRAQPGFNPNTRHCLHGLDADLIMLGLATHEPHFCVLREDVLGKPSNKCFICGGEGHRADQCDGTMAVSKKKGGKEQGDDGDSPTSLRALIARKPLQLLHLSTLREYLDLEFCGLAPALPFGYDLERVIDDFVFMCFFVGNDFLPHLPSMDIREGAIDLLMALYKQVLPSLGGFLTMDGSVDLGRVDVLLSRVGAVEDEIFRRRRAKEDKDKVYEAQRKAQRQGNNGRQQHQGPNRSYSSSSAASSSSSAAAAAAPQDSSFSSGAPQAQPSSSDGYGAAVLGISLVDEEAAAAAVSADAANAVVDAAKGALDAHIKGPLRVRAAAGAVIAAGIQHTPVAGLEKRGAAEAASAAATAAAAAAGSKRPRGAGGDDDTGPWGHKVVRGPDGLPLPPPPPAAANNKSAAAALRASLLGKLVGPAAAASALRAGAAAAAAAVVAAEAIASDPTPPAADAPVSSSAAAVVAVSMGVEVLESGSAATSEETGAGGAPDAGEAAAAVSAAAAAAVVAVSSSGAEPHAAMATEAPPASPEELPTAPGVQGAAPPPATPIEPPSSDPEGPPPLAADAPSSSAPAISPQEEEAEEEAAVTEALEEGLLEEGVAASISAVLKTSVLKALLVKRTKESVEDNVQFGVSGWKDRYYGAKFGEEAVADPSFRPSVCASYTEGLVWVFKYYYTGVASWQWFYPHHYAPFASDLRSLDTVRVHFDLGKPFRPLDQLMSVLPPRSAHALPPACAALMTDPHSTILDFYPTRFAMDPNGKKFTWQWVVLLPFIDEARLVAAIDGVAGTFSEGERRRNSLGTDLLFVHNAASAPLARALRPLLPALGGAAAAVAAAAPASAAASSGGSSSSSGAPDSGAAPSSSGDAAAAAASPSAAAPSPTSVVALRPDFADPQHKGLSARCMSLEAAGGGRRGLASVAIGGRVPSPWRPVLPDVNPTNVIFVAMLPPVRRAHACKLLPGVEIPVEILGADDEPSGRVPRLTKGLNIADLAFAGAGAQFRQAQFLNQQQHQQPLLFMHMQQQAQQQQQQAMMRGGPAAGGLLGVNPQQQLQQQFMQQHQPQAFGGPGFGFAGAQQQQVQQQMMLQQQQQQLMLQQQLLQQQQQQRGMVGAGGMPGFGATPAAFQAGALQHPMFAPIPPFGYGPNLQQQQLQLLQLQQQQQRMAMMGVVGAPGGMFAPPMQPQYPHPQQQLLLQQQMMQQQQQQQQLRHVFSNNGQTRGRGR